MAPPPEAISGLPAADRIRMHRLTNRPQCPPWAVVELPPPCDFFLDLENVKVRNSSPDPSAPISTAQHLSRQRLFTCSPGADLLGAEQQGSLPEVTQESKSLSKLAWVLAPLCSLRVEEHQACFLSVSAAAWLAQRDPGDPRSDGGGGYQDTGSLQLPVFPPRCPQPTPAGWPRSLGPPKAAPAGKAILMHPPQSRDNQKHQAGRSESPSLSPNTNKPSPTLKPLG
ncbi:hypothetical protein P7K49_013075 [Saguinus oedipus]|uniref:Uncharacterized protein n=1 Tax=Saguinus oedipus TaxID=9490 RepID=A0ABQ9VFQ9_SAGOE|nr:hypothetical protein P7K49_013075 [Saguinus oedipus]